MYEAMPLALAQLLMASIITVMVPEPVGPAILEAFIPAFALSERVAHCGIFFLIGFFFFSPSALGSSFFSPSALGSPLDSSLSVAPFFPFLPFLLFFAFLGASSLGGSSLAFSGALSPLGTASAGADS